jgi:hypothetical protein
MSSIIKVDTVQDQDGNNIINENANTITIGASGDTITIPAGATINNQGTAVNFGATGSASWVTDSIKTATFTATAGEGYFCNTTAGAFTVNLPAGSAGAVVAVKDYAGTFNSNNLTIAANGSDKIGGITVDAILSEKGIAVTLVFIDSTQGWLVTDSGLQSESPQPYSVDMLVIAGGGGGSGGNHGSGGGAGGYRTSTQGITPGSTVTVTVGDGGTGNNDNTSNGGNGSDSSISGTGLTTITSTGGGGGGAVSNGTSPAGTGSNGGSGGGGSARSDGATSVGGISSPVTSPVQGYAGGGNGGYGASPYPGSGGGGAGGVGGNATSNSNAGAGGPGASSSITGSAVTRAGGGGGNVYSGGTAGAGGSGGGGAGGLNGSGSAATVNTGSGGGGGGGAGTGTGGNGGKGVVILSMPDADYSGTTTGSPTVATGVSGKTILTFNSSGSYTG